MTNTLVTDAETLALNCLSFLASQVGVATLSGVLDVLIGGGTSEAIVEDLSQLVGSLAEDVLLVLGPDKAKAAVKALFDAADVVVEAAEDAKFPKP